MIKPLGTSNLPRLFLQSGKQMGNQAVPKEALISRRPNGLRFRSLVKQWFSPGDSFHGWLFLKDGKLCGVVSVRERSSRSTWEIDRLLFSEPDQDAGQALLEAVGSAAAERGVLKVFLRLPQDSPILSIAAKAGFCTYLEEKLFRSKGISLGPKMPESNYSLQPCSEAEAQVLFQLYCQVVPAAVRCVEGMTLNEWQATSWEPVSRRRQLACLEPASSRRQYTCWQEDELIGWLRVSSCGRAGIIELMAQPKHMEAMLDYGLSCLRHKSYVNYLVPAFQGDLAVLLQEHKFELAGNYISLVQETASRVRQPQLAPLKA